MNLKCVAGFLAVCGTITGWGSDFLQGGVEEVLSAEAKAPPPPLPEVERRRILASLPAEGRVAVEGPAAGKIAALAPVLRAYGRESETEILVVRLPYAGAA